MRLIAISLTLALVAAACGGDDTGALPQELHSTRYGAALVDDVRGRVRGVRVGSPSVMSIPSPSRSSRRTARSRIATRVLAATVAGSSLVAASSDSDYRRRRSAIAPRRVGAPGKAKQEHQQDDKHHGGSSYAQLLLPEYGSSLWTVPTVCPFQNFDTAGMMCFAQSSS